MLESLRNYATNIGYLLLIFAAFAIVERLRPAERGQPLRASWFNVRYLVVFEFINLLLLPLLTALVVDRLRAAWPAAFALIRVDGYLDGAWKAVAFLFVYDFFYYWFHRLQHEWGFLWPQHQLHHSELSLNATTTFRHHWLEELLRVFAIVLPMAMLFDLKPYESGIVAFFIGLWPVFIHANVRLTFGPFARVLAGPQLHRIHHSLERQHLDHNYAAFFPLWDQLFGTYHHPGTDEYPRTGLVSGERVTSIAQALWLPFGIWFRGRSPEPQPTQATSEPTSSQRKAPGRRVVIAAWCVALGLALVAIEIVARIVFPLPPLANFNRIEYAPTTLTAEMRSKQYLMNATISWTSEPDHAGSVLHLNLYGFRDGQWDVAHKRARRILFVGDSFVEGFMAADDEAIPAVFARRAKASGRSVEVFNLGVGGTDLADYMKLIQDAVPALAPEEVVLVFYANDFAGQPPFSHAQVRPAFEPKYRSPWMPRIAQVTRRLLAGEPVALAWHGKPKPFLAPVPDPSNPWTAQGDYLATRVDPEFADAMRRATFNPHSVDELAEYAHYFRETVDVSAHLTFLRDFLKARNVQLRLAYIPYPAQVSDYYIPFKHRYGGRDVQSMSGPEFQVQAKHLTDVAGRLGIPFLDLTPSLRAREAAGEHLYWDYDHHFRPTGYAFAANALYDWAAAANDGAPLLAR
jgi:sterol desaturase/sphingolipid hydroxylase (fatty acid hydroxylase superfamily)/lysophospholipase L1-like esterase